MDVADLDGGSAEFLQAERYFLVSYVSSRSGSSFRLRSDLIFFSRIGESGGMGTASRYLDDSSAEFLQSERYVLAPFHIQIARR